MSNQSQGKEIPVSSAHQSVNLLPVKSGADDKGVLNISVKKEQPRDIAAPQVQGLDQAHQQPAAGSGNLPHPVDLRGVPVLRATPNPFTYYRFTSDRINPQIARGTREDSNISLGNVGAMPTLRERPNPSNTSKYNYNVQGHIYKYPCGQGGCAATFKTSIEAEEHRRICLYK